MLGVTKYSIDTVGVTLSLVEVLVIAALVRPSGSTLTFLTEPSVITAVARTLNWNLPVGLPSAAWAVPASAVVAAIAASTVAAFEIFFIVPHPSPRCPPCADRPCCDVEAALRRGAPPSIDHAQATF